MSIYIMSVGWTAQGIQAIKNAPARFQASRELARKLGVEIKQIYLTSGEHDLLVILETANDDNIAKFALALGAQGNVRTRTVKAWSEAEFLKFVSELP